MGDVLQFRPIPKDGGKSRIRRRREALRLAISAKKILDDLAMDHADPEDIHPSELA